MTESEWQEISDLLAREVMGYSYSYAHGAACWSYPIGPRHGGIILQSQWQPHNIITQAMLVLKTLLEKMGRYAEAELNVRIQPSRCRVIIQNWVASDGTPAGFVQSPYVDNEMQAMCLAVKEWCETFKEET